MAYLTFHKRVYDDWEPTAYDTDQVQTCINVSVTDIVGAAFMRVTEAFNGGSSDATLELGDAGVTDRFITTSNVNALNTGLNQGTGAGLATMPGYLYTCADTVDINCITDTNNDGSTGICDVWIYVASADMYA